MKYVLKYTDGQTEDAEETLEDAMYQARQIYDCQRKLWKQVDGIYTDNGVGIILHNMMEVKFDDEDRALEDDGGDEVYGSYAEQHALRISDVL